MVYAVFALAAFVVQAAVVIIVFLAQMLLILLQVFFAFLSWLLPILWGGCVRAGQGSIATVHGLKRAKLPKSNIPVDSPAAQEHDAQIA
jgi:hypothetical protein